MKYKIIAFHLQEEISKTELDKVSLSIPEDLSEEIANKMIRDAKLAALAVSTSGIRGTLAELNWYMDIPRADHAVMFFRPIYFVGE